MQPIFTNYDIYLFDYQTLHKKIMQLNERLYKIRGINAHNEHYKLKEMEHIKITLDVLNCDFLRRYNYLPIFTPL